MYKSLALYKNVLDNLQECIYFVDSKRKIFFWNKEAERVTGFTAEEMIDSYCCDHGLQHVDEVGTKLCMNGCPLEKTLEDGKQREVVAYLHHKKGHRVAVLIRTLPIYQDGKIVGAVETFSDNFDQIRMRREIDRLHLLAMYDQLTDLPNRRYIDSYLEHAFQDYQLLEISFGVLMMDIDHFGIFNNTYGHDVGDKVLTMISRSIENALRKDDFVGRWGGEEFMVIIKDISVKDLKGVAEKIRILVENSFLQSGDHHLKVTISIGGTLIKEIDTIESVQKRADDALYISKDSGRNCVTIQN